MGAWDVVDEKPAATAAPAAPAAGGWHVVAEQPVAPAAPAPSIVDRVRAAFGGPVVDGHRQVSAAESIDRGVAGGLNRVVATAGMIPKGYAALADMIHGAFTGNTARSELQDTVGRHLVDPYLNEAHQFDVNPETEHQSFGAKLAGDTASMAPDLALMAATGGASALPEVAGDMTARTLVRQAAERAIRHSARASVAPALVHGSEAATNATEAGASPIDAVAQLPKTYMEMVAQNALPLAGATRNGAGFLERVLTRGAQGAVTLPAAAGTIATLEGHPLTAEQYLAQAATGAVMGQMSHGSEQPIDLRGDTQALKDTASHPDTPHAERLAALLQLMQRGETTEQPTPAPDLNDPTLRTAAEPAQQGVPVMITQKMRADLEARGYTTAEIFQMTPQAAHDALRQPATPAPATPEASAPSPERAGPAPLPGTPFKDAAPVRDFTSNVRTSAWGPAPEPTVTTLPDGHPAPAPVIEPTIHPDTKAADGLATAESHKSTSKAGNVSTVRKLIFRPTHDDLRTWIAANGGLSPEAAKELGIDPKMGRALRPGIVNARPIAPDGMSIDQAHERMAADGWLPHEGDHAPSTQDVRDQLYDAIHRGERIEHPLSTAAERAHADAQEHAKLADEALAAEHGISVAELYDRGERDDEIRRQREEVGHLGLLARETPRLDAESDADYVARILQEHPDGPVARPETPDPVAHGEGAEAGAAARSDVAEPAPAETRTPAAGQAPDGGAEKAYLDSVNPGGKRLTDEDIQQLDAIGHIDLPADATPIKTVRDRAGNTVELHRGPDGSVYASIDGTPVGHIGLQDGEVVNHVLPAHRGRGIGTAIAKEFLRDNPDAQSGGFSDAGEATRRAAYRELQAEKAAPASEPAAAPAAEPQLEDGATGIRKGVVNAERAAKGKDAIEASQKLTDEAAHAEAGRVLSENPDAGRDLAHDLLANPRAASKVEKFILARERQRIETELREATQDIVDAMDKGDAAAETAARMRQMAADQESELNDHAAASTGSESGRSLQGQKAIVNADYSLGHMLNRAKAAYGKLDDALRKQVSDMADRIRTLEEIVARKDVPRGRRRTVRLNDKTVAMTEVLRLADAIKRRTRENPRGHCEL